MVDRYTGMLDNEMVNKQQMETRMANETRMVDRNSRSEWQTEVVDKGVDKGGTGRRRVEWQTKQFILVFKNGSPDENMSLIS